MSEGAVIDLGLGHVRVIGARTLTAPNLGSEYGPAEGFPILREAVAAWEKVRTEEVAITTGASMGLVATLSTLPAGSSVLCPRPYYPAYPKVMETLGLRALYYDLDAGAEWQPRSEQLDRLIRADTRALLINFPGNPAGNLPCPTLLNDLRDIVRRGNLTVISDEVYTDFIYNDYCFPDFHALFAPAPVVRLRSFSKLFGIPGERLGYVIAGASHLKDISRAHWALAMSPPATSQALALSLLRASPEERARHLRGTLADIRKRVFKILSACDRIRFHAPPAGIFYWLEITDCNLDSPRLAQECLKQAGLIVVPGAAFGMERPAYLRTSFAVPKEDAVAGFKALVKFLNQPNLG